MFCVSSFRCHGLICGLWLWHFVVIFTCFLQESSPNFSSTFPGLTAISDFQHFSRQINFQEIFSLMQSGGTWGSDPPWKIMPSSVHQWNAIEMAFRWWADGGPLRVSIQTPSPLCKIWWLKQKKIISDPPSPDKTFWIGACFSNPKSLQETNIPLVCS